MSDLITRTDQSLIRQSFKARERKEPLNGDGFGVGWYMPEIDSTPCVFTSITPAWSNRNLHRLADKIRSTCFFAHVRAATSGLSVSEFNCHPFQYEDFLWMHNGSIAEFSTIRRKLRSTLDDLYYNFIQGTTDSEHAFAVFLSNLQPQVENYTYKTLIKALIETIQQLDDWTAESGITKPSYHNFAVTDGHNILVSRYTNDPTMEPATLYYSSGESFAIRDGVYRMLRGGRKAKCVIIASEPITEIREDWVSVPRNHIVTVTPEMHLHITPVE